jgi:hypothetical protein
MYRLGYLKWYTKHQYSACVNDTVARATVIPTTEEIISTTTEGFRGTRATTKETNPIPTTEEPTTTTDPVPMLNTKGPSTTKVPSIVPNTTGPSDTIPVLVPDITGSSGTIPVIVPDTTGPLDSLTTEPLQPFPPEIELPAQSFPPELELQHEASVVKINQGGEGEQFTGKKSKPNAAKQGAGTVSFLMLIPFAISFFCF